MDYRREIDGLRALAIIPVILFHAGFQSFSGGFVGVDVFFVISGYLITRIILAELREGKFSIINFYERRARRILPALFLIMFLCLLFAWLWLPPDNMRGFSKSLIAVSMFASNLLFWKESGYFDTAAGLKPLLHTWSLAIEEQYYVLFPLFLVFTWKLGKNWVLTILTAIFMLSLGTAQWSSSAKPIAAFYLLPTRGWELLVGAFVGFYEFTPSRSKFADIGSWLGLTLILYAILTFDNRTPFPSFYTLIPAVGTALIILFTNDKTAVGKILNHKVFVGIGLISYSLYLWHHPLFRV
jgi:peptidoglycan/LPS O-acetylase OafA/YrhL